VIEDWILTLSWLVSLNSNVIGKGTTTGGVDLFRGGIPMMVLYQHGQRGDLSIACNRSLEQRISRHVVAMSQSCVGFRMGNCAADGHKLCSPQPPDTAILTEATRFGSIPH